MFHNLGKGRFDSVGASLGAAFNVPQVGPGRGLRRLRSRRRSRHPHHQQPGPARLLRNDGGNRNHWLTIRTVGTKSNRDGIGAVVRVESPSGAQWQTVHSGSSYCSQSDLALTFGLGPDTTVKSIDVAWPSGTKDRVTGVAANQFVRMQESAGICEVTGTVPLPERGYCPQARCRPGRSTSTTK